MSGSPTEDEIFLAMKQAVEANPSLKTKFNASVVFELGTKESPKSFRLDATKKSPPKEKPDLKVITSLAVFHDLLNKKITPQQAFMKGKLKIKGKMGLAMKLQLVLNATRKQLMQSSPRSRL